MMSVCSIDHAVAVFFLAGKRSHRMKRSHLDPDDAEDSVMMIEGRRAKGEVQLVYEVKKTPLKRLPSLIRNPTARKMKYPD